MWNVSVAILVVLPQLLSGTIMQQEVGTPDVIQSKSSPLEVA